MAPSPISSTRLHNTTPWDLTTVLVSAMLEWVLIFFLFIDAIFAYAIKKFAHGCKLQTPCLLCSRLDHVFGDEKKGHYWDLICGNHKSEISSFVLCHAHNKLVDVRGMCETCLFSFATINKSNAETYRLLVGKLGDAADSEFDQDPLLEDQESCFRTRWYCSCCNKPLVTRRHVQKLIGLETTELDVPLTGSIKHDQKDLEKRSKRSFDTLSHIGYAELKISSDTESEATTSDDDSTRCRICKTDGMKEELSASLVEPCIIKLVDDLASEKHIDPLDTNEHGLKFVESGFSIGHGLEELNWHQVGSKADSFILTEPDLDCVASSPNAVEVPSELTNDSYTTDTGEVGQMYSAECREPYKGGENTSETGLETKPLMHDATQQTSNILELGDAYKLAVGDSGKDLSTTLAENWNRKDSSRFSEDFKLLPSEVSANQGIEQSVNDLNPKLSVNSDDLKISDSFGIQILQKRTSLERNESGLSLDGSIVSEIEGESVVDRLKRQAEHDRKLMAALYKELEEERNASSVAANQAMAMITRLQEEKAALHMEALQYLRMMEEQAEYDDKALQKSNDLLAEKEKEVQDLEAELEFYRNELTNKPSLDDDLEKRSCEMKTRDIGMDHSESCEVPASENDDRSDVNNFLLEFEDEKMFILQCLKNLENELHFLPSGEVNSSFSKVDFLENGKDDISKPAMVNVKENYPESCGTDEKDDVSLSGWNSHAERDNNFFGNSQLNDKAICESCCCSRKSCEEGSQITDFAHIGFEFLSLNKRLEALESDLKFLEHTIHSLKNGDKGFDFIQEITSHLLELRKLSINRMKL